jgi:hypothetical protein
MEAIVGVWLTSILGAGAFSAAGYVLGQRGVVLPLLGITAPPRGPSGTVVLGVTPTPDAPVITLTPSAPDVHLVTPAVPEAARREAEVTVERVTLVPGSQPKLPKSEPAEETTRVAPMGSDIAAAAAAAAAASIELESLRADVQAALSRAEAAAQKARSAEVLRSELERQIETLQKELRVEAVARTNAETRAQELGDRLAGASEEAATLRHKVASLDKQTKQLREALQGRVRALTTSEWHRRRDLEDAEEIRKKLNEVSTKLERSSMPPDESGMPPSSGSLSDLRVPRDTPSRGALDLGHITHPPAPATRSLRPSIDEAAALREEVSRLTAENRSLRVRALASAGVVLRPPASRGLPTDVNLDLYRMLIDRIGTVAGLRGAVVGDDVGAVLVGSGEYAEGLAAFGAYIRDASTRINGLLPLEEIEEVDLRDKGGMLLSTLVLPAGGLPAGGHVSQAPSGLCLVLLGAAAASMIAAKKVVKETLRRGSGASSIG